MDYKADKYYLHWKVETSKGVVNFRAEAFVKDNTLILSELGVDPDGKHKTGLNSEIQAARYAFFQRAKEQGFTAVEISALRVAGANPLRDVHKTVDLAKYTAQTVKPFVPHQDPLLREGQNIGRLKALEKPFKTKEALELKRHDKHFQQDSDLHRSRSLERSFAPREERKSQPSVIKKKDKGKDYE